MNESEIKARVDAALAALVARDAFLLERRVGERAIVAKIASYMAPLFRDYDVDVEYNRQGLNPHDPKELPLPATCRGGGKKRVYPDIIVHRRGNLRSLNLLVIEVKRQSNREPRDCDLAKIAAMKRKYRYRFGVLIEVPSGPGAREREATQDWR